jgi:hypothetical protein
MDFGEYSRNAAATATGQCAAAGRQSPGRQASDDARTHGATSDERCLLRLPSAHGSDRLSVENFDAVGRWRNRDTDDSQVDATGSLPSGVTFTGVDGLKKALLDNPDAFVATASEKLLTYAVGRGSIITMPRPCAPSFAMPAAKTIDSHRSSPAWLKARHSR